ncbi:lysine--tRNA ligase [Thermogladius sp. KZ2Tp1]|uniref:lysine--tRNA ligase n=1 Tax=Thermogladius sp. KZ2Tp1 TaxID=3136289 RepID=UPI003DAA13AA
MSGEVEHRKRVREELISKNINPYPHKPLYQPASLRSVLDSPVEGAEVAVAGRVAAVRRHGGLVFLDIVDDGLRIQASIDKSKAGDVFEFFGKYVDLGDFVNVKGVLYRTRRGELTVDVRGLHLLAKSLRAPPVKYGHRLLDPEVRYRKRYLDMMLTPDVRRVLEVKFKVLEETRRFMWGEGFVEVETPVIQPIYGGAEARPFKTHVWALNTEWYLRISLELHLKRFIIGGFNKVFEIGKVFRNEDIDAQHNPEFTMLEAYQAYADYNDMMDLTEELISHLAEKVVGRNVVEVPVGDVKERIDLSRPFKRMTMYEAFKEYAGIDVEKLGDDEIRDLLAKNAISLAGGYDRGRAIVKLFDKLVGRKYLVQPVFITDYPRSSSPLAKPHRYNPDLAERFELFIAGMEIANAYTELNDPVLQAEYFRAEEERRKRGDEEAHPFDWDFVEALEYGMPPTGGLGVGLDRVSMVLAGVSSIKEVIPFPMMK